jgi:hypothetical protein
MWLAQEVWGFVQNISGKILAKIFSWKERATEGRISFR